MQMQIPAVYRIITSPLVPIALLLALAAILLVRLEADLGETQRQLAVAERAREGLASELETARTQVAVSAQTLEARAQACGTLEAQLHALTHRAAAWERRARDADDTSRPLPGFSRW